MKMQDRNNLMIPEKDFYHADCKIGFCIIIPVYNHHQTVMDVVCRALKLNIPVYVVDDGSNDGSSGRINAIQGIRVLRHFKNLGKGAALMTGFCEAFKDGMRWAITVDADGQHDPLESILLMDAVADRKRAIVIGKRTGMKSDHVPWTSRFGKKFSNFWVRMAGGPKISDSQSGFRIYPLPETLDLHVGARRFQFEVEVLAKAGWKGIPVTEIPVKVCYQPGHNRVSHFRPFVDFLRNTGTFTRLIFQRLLIPASFRKKG